jgi:hypothetical protein
MPQDHGHPIAQLRAQLVWCGRDDREAAYPLARRRAPVLPQACQSHQTPISERYRIWLFPSRGLLPPIKVFHLLSIPSALALMF